MLPEPGPANPEPAPPPPPIPTLNRVIALLEVLICSDFLTQFALGGTLSAFGYQPYRATDG